MSVASNSVANAVGGDGRVEGGLCVGAAHDDLVAVGILAVLVAEEDRDTAEIGARDRGVVLFRCGNIHLGAYPGLLHQLLLIGLQMHIGGAQLWHRNFCRIGTRDEIADHVIGFHG